MLCNNLDPRWLRTPMNCRLRRHGKGRRNWDAFDAICRSKDLADDETLGASGSLWALCGHPRMPEVLIANSNLVGEWATWDHQPSRRA